MKKDEILNSVKDTLRNLNQSKRDIDNLHAYILEPINENENRREKIESILGDIGNDWERCKSLKGDLVSELKAIRSFRDKQKAGFEKNNTDILALLDRARTRVTGRATTVELIKIFTDKVGEYIFFARLWAVLFLALTGCGAFFIHEFVKAAPVDLERIVGYTLIRLPFAGLFVWLGMFFGSRRAENKKLAEAYRHKEVMARAYFGYRKSVEKISQEVKVEKDLSQAHMQYLLKAISKDSSDFLKLVAEKHPFLDAIDNAKIAKEISNKSSGG